eukprot:jgi/Mesen1/8586/ME000005S08552
MAAAIVMKRREEEAEGRLRSVSFSDDAGRDGIEHSDCEDDSKQELMSAEQKREAEDLDILYKLCLKVRETQLNRSNYFALACFLSFVTVFMTVLYLQQQSFKTYETVSTHKQLLPDNTFVFDHAGDIYDWINNTILQTIYTDPDCGNGICSYPEEFPGFGRFGCIADCGVLTNVTPVNIKFTTDFQSEDEQKEASWNLCMTSPTQLCWYSNAQSFRGPLATQTQDKVILPDGTWQIRITAPHGGVTGEVELIEKVANEKFDLKTTSLTEWGSCKPRNESKLAMCRTACARFAVCSTMACRNMGEHAMASIATTCYEVCNEAPESVISSYSNISCYGVACAINGSTSFLNTDKAFYSCIPEPLYDGRPPDGGLVMLPFDEDGLRVTGFNDTPKPVGPGYCTESGSDSGSSSGASGRRLLGTSLWPSLYGLGSNKRSALAVAAAMEPPPDSFTSVTDEVAAAPAVDPTLNYTWPSVTPWEMLGPNDFARMTNLQAAVARALFTWPKTECTCPRKYYIDPEKNGARFVAFFCAYMGGPSDFPGCNYTHPVTGRQLTTLMELNQAMGHVHDALGFEFAKDEVAVFLDIMVSSIQSVAALPPASLWEQPPAPGGLHAHQHQPAPRMVLSWRVGVNYNTTIWNGSLIKWVWEDSTAHSIREIQRGSLGPFAEFRGVGSGYMAVDRSRVCDATNSYFLPIDKLPPVPCNLINVESTSAQASGGFSYSWQFDKPGEYRYEDAHFGSLMTGTVHVVDRSQNLAVLAALTGNLPVETALCAPQCPLFALANGQCLEACNVQNCNFDGGDCSCFDPEFGTNSCTCYPGQSKSTEGECCEPGTVGSELLFTFTLDKYGGGGTNGSANRSFLPDDKHVKDRVFAFKNRLLVGMLIHQTRGTTIECKNRRFENLHSKCLDRTPSVAPYGVDPVFLATSSLYNPDLDAEDFYVAPVEFTPLGSPFGFFHHPAKGYKPGFSAIFDINLSSEEAQSRLSYLIEGYFIDNATRTVEVQLVTYNGNQQQFTNTDLKVEFQPGGKLAVTWSIDAVRMELYRTRTDWFRAILEGVLFASVCYQLYGEMVEWYTSWGLSQRLFAYFDSFWNVIDLCSLGLLFVSSILWMSHYIAWIAPFEVVPRYDVYANVTSGARFWLLNNGGRDFEAAMSKFVRINAIMAFRSAYMALSGIRFTHSHPSALTLPYCWP